MRINWSSPEAICWFFASRWRWLWVYFGVSLEIKSCLVSLCPQNGRVFSRWCSCVPASSVTTRTIAGCTSGVQSEPTRKAFSWLWFWGSEILTGVVLIYLFGFTSHFAIQHLASLRPEIHSSLLVDNSKLGTKLKIPWFLRVLLMC